MDRTFLFFYYGTDRTSSYYGHENMKRGGGGHVCGLVHTRSVWEPLEKNEGPIQNKYIVFSLTHRAHLRSVKRCATRFTRF